MKRPMSDIPLDDVRAAWMRDPAFVQAYDALEVQYARAARMIAARGSRTPAQWADALGTTVAVITRLESGKVTPSARMLQRIAAARR
jgi:transcriptional regulator with XRE-family HTH domain